jgi:serine/threonine-protein kinase
MMLGPYRILEKLGEGGMGEVYKARDTRLDRTVAIKVLPPDVIGDPERRARFEREAKTIAGLNHPHICTLHDVGDHDGAMFLVMEHLAGESLADRLSRGPLPFAQALDIAAQIAEALDAAHKHGIIHRDLKPGNVMLTKAGAKLLDFGLAKLKSHGAEPAAGHLASMPTQSAPLTVEGTIVGTLQYMAPEQLEGKEADARTDLWALGAILYEMVTGRRAFAGDSQVSLIGNIMNAEPAGLATLQPLTPPALERLVKKCLAKHPDDRWDSAHDVADELRWIGQGSGAQAAVPEQRSKKHVWLARSIWGLALASVAVLGAVVGQWMGIPGVGRPRGSADGRVARLDLVLPSDAPFWIDPQGFAPSFALSPDGTVMAYTCTRGAGTQLCLRRLDRDEVSPMAGTDNARYPTFSPDGQSILFCDARRYTTVCEPGAALKKLSMRDARVDPLGTVPEGLSWLLTLAWTPDDRILVSGFGGIWIMPASGGVAAPVLRTDTARGEVSVALPTLLPDGRRMLYSISRIEGGQAVWDVQVLTLATGEQQLLLKNANFASYLPTGHLLYHEGNVTGPWVVAPFDAARLASGTPVPLWDAARHLGGWPAVAISRSGTLLYLPMDEGRVLTWVDRQQRTVPALQARGAWQSPKISPDGRRVAVEIAKGGWRSGIALVDLDRGVPTEFVSEGRSPLWAPDGKRIAFGSLGFDNLSWQAVDGSGNPEVMHRAPRLAHNQGSWSPDGLRLAYGVKGDNIQQETWILSKEGSVWTPRRFGAESFDAAGPRFSPDGRWVAYHSNALGRWEVYVVAYPGADRRTQVSVDGGHDAVWSSDGRELYYREGDRFYGVSVTLAPTFSVGRPQLLFSGPYLDSGPLMGSDYDVSPDGQRFLVVQVSDEERAPRRFHLIQNWFEELKAKVPSGGAR